MSTEPDEPTGAAPGEPTTVHDGGPGELTPTHSDPVSRTDPARGASTDGAASFGGQATCSLHAEPTGMTVASVGHDATFGRRPRSDISHIFGMIGRFEYRAELGEGGCGIVFLAYDPVLNRLIALKIPRPDALVSTEMRARFLTEARAAAALDHPNIVRVYEASEVGALCYLASAYCEGGSLAHWIKRHEGPIPPRQAARWVAELASAVQHAHEQGVLHRDLKPSNVLLVRPKRLTGSSDLAPVDEFTPLVSDFGLAKLMEQESSTTMSGAVLGSPSYMSPEQARGRTSEVSPASDVYGLGAILYELLTRKPPFRGESRQETLQLVIGAELVPPRRIDPTVPKDLETICLKCLSKDPRARYASASDLADDLTAFVAGDRIQAVREGWRRPVQRWARRHRGALASGLVVCWALGLTAVVLRNGHRTSGPPASLPRPPGPQRVWVETKPPGARVVFVPLDPLTGEPVPERAVRPPDGTTTPLTVELPPALYFVEAQTSARQFHQVYRTVPTPGQARYVAPHRRWETRDDGTIELPVVTLPEERIAQDMVRFGDSGPPPRRPGTGAFYLDRTEVTVGEYLRVAPRLPVRKDGESPSADEPVRYVSFDEATHYAERLGKRLPTAAEYEYAATDGGTRKYPWGESPEPLTRQPWTYGLAGEPAFDRTDTTPPVLGLYSNVVEWTSTWAASGASAPLPGAADDRNKALLEATPAEYLDARVVCGGPLAVAYRQHGAAADAVRQGPTARFALPRLPSPPAPGLGFRCARSVAPRFLTPGAGR